MLYRIDRQSYLGLICAIGPRKASHSFSLVIKVEIHLCMLIVIQLLLGDLHVVVSSSAAYKHSLTALFDCMSIESFRGLSTRVLHFVQGCSNFTILNIDLRDSVYAATDTTPKPS